MNIYPLSNGLCAKIKQQLNQSRLKLSLILLSVVAMVSSSSASELVESAYQQQQAYIANKLQTEQLLGYKAGLTSKAGQQKFNVSEPLHGALFSSGKLDPSQAISLSAYHKLMMELELGFVLAQAIDEPLTSIDQLKLAVAYLVPVIELPDLRFEDLFKVTGLDLIRANVAANAVLVGEPITAWQSLDINRLHARLSRTQVGDKAKGSQQLVVEGYGKDAMGDQWQALLWLINQRVKLGEKLLPGQLLITGALGKMVPAKIGQYKAEFGALGVLEFELIQ